MNRVHGALVLALVVLLSGCGDGELTNVRKFCPLAAMPHRTLPEVSALRAAGAKLLGHSTALHYKKGARNTRIVSATFALLDAARIKEEQLAKPALFPRNLETGLDNYASQLRGACAQ